MVIDTEVETFLIADIAPYLVKLKGDDGFGEGIGFDVKEETPARASVQHVIVI